jgi:NADPH-dependent curcumin reductase CurA
MRGATIAKIIASKSTKFTVGDLVTCNPGWTEIAVIADKDPSLQLANIPSNGKITDVLGCLGGTGLTAYFGMTDIAKVKAGDFVVVSGAAGATGSIACQIAKLKGAKVLGIAGSDDKVAWLKELGCDDALNYKAADFKEQFKAKTPDLIDVFYDNVGGEVLELAFSRAKMFARFVICGGKFLPCLSSWFKLIPPSYFTIQFRQTTRPKGILSKPTLALSSSLTQHRTSQ